MNSSPDLDWSLWRSFLAVMNAGSLSGAARHLNLSQPTLGRHIEALEAALGLSLFERQLRGLRPTETALRLFEHVRNASEALAAANLVAAGSAEQPTGTVRLTASTVTSHYTLPPILAALRAEHPEIDIELDPSDSAQNLLMRDADIAIRMFRPSQNELITKKLADSSLSACAHQSYLARHGTPETIEDLARLDLVGFDKSDLLIEGAAQLGVTMSRHDFGFRTDSQTAIWQLIIAGCGVGFAQDCIIERTPGMRALLPQLNIPPLEVWLTTHHELYLNRHIRVIYDALSEHLIRYYNKTPAQRPTSMSETSS